MFNIIAPSQNVLPTVFLLDKIFLHSEDVCLVELCQYESDIYVGDGLDIDHGDLFLFHRFPVLICHRLLFHSWSRMYRSMGSLSAAIRGLQC